MKSRLLLHCDASHSVFTLTKPGEGWRQQFTDLREALDVASRKVTEETPLIVYNELGRVIVESTVSPRPQKDGSDRQ
jgi:hypothetical protein